MSKRNTIVLPIFSLKDERLKGLVTNEALDYEKEIEKALKKYNNIEKREREISIDLLSLRLRNLPGSHSAPLQKAIFIYCEKETVTTPFLLGLVPKQKFLSRINDILSIEIFEEEQLFLDRFGRPTQLCIRRYENGLWFVDISTYVAKNLINAGERESGNSINTLSFVEEKLPEEDIGKTEDLSNKIIR
ncbi:hypothetical protein IT402_01545 [Candidatus Nomurabacteria bacterium]|nr:hypothetical protein [Candidatus Nomurabacteria bacterium]